MGMEPKITKLARSLIIFNGTTSFIVGTIDLDIHSPLVVYLQIFMVIDEVSPITKSWADHASARLTSSSPLPHP